MKRKGYETPDVRVKVMITADVLYASGTGYVADGDGGQYFEDFFPTQS